MSMGEGGSASAARLVELFHRRDLLDLEIAQEAALFAATDEYDRQGSLSPKDWIRHNCKLRGREAADLVWVGGQLAGLSESAAAVEQGVIGFGHLALIARTRQAVADSPLASARISEEQLLGNAADISVDAFFYVCQKLRHAADPGGVALDEQDAIEARRFHMSEVPGSLVAISGRLDPAAAALLRSVLEPLARKEGKDDHRSRDQRMADALVEVGMHTLGGCGAKGGRAKPHLQLTVPIDTLLGLAGAAAADLQYGDPISSRLVELLACDCKLTTIILDREGQVLEVGRTQRLATPAQEKALNVRDGGCVVPGCNRPAAWCTPHHLRPWAQGGPTDLVNLCLLCSRHHTLVHMFGWKVARGADGRWAWIPPQMHWLDTWRTRERVRERLELHHWYDTLPDELPSLPPPSELVEAIPC